MAAANLFAVHTGLQHMTVTQMVRTLPEFREASNIIVFDMPTDGLNMVNSLWADVIIIKPPIGRYRIGSGSACRRTVLALEKTIASFEKVRLFVSDIEWPLNNALYGLFRARKMPVCNYPDGIGSLLYYPPTFKRQLRSLAKKLIGLLGGLPHYLYPGDIMGLNAADAVYSLLPAALPPDINPRIVGIPLFQPQAVNVIPDSCLFLGQDYDRLFPPEEHARLCREAAAFAASLGYTRKLYKGHHFAKAPTEKEAFLSRGFEILADTRPVEELFMTSQLSCVISYNSSALVHLKLMFGDKVRCISTFSDWTFKHTIMGRGQAETIYRVFDLSGVERYN